MVLGLWGCDRKPLTYVYLMQHADEMQQAVADCQGQSTPECMMVKKAAQDYVDLNNIHQDNPELFGQRLLQTQQDYAKVTADLNTLKQKPSDANNQKQMVALSEQATALSEKISAMLAIVALTSPE